MISISVSLKCPPAADASETTVTCDQRHAKTGLTNMVFYTPLQKKRNTWLWSSHDPSLGPATPRGQKAVTL